MKQENIIKSVLSKLDFEFNQVNTSSIYFTKELAVNNIHPKIAIDLDKANLFKADAVYFRFFDNGRMPQPQIYIYDNSDNHIKDFAEIHRNIWSASEIPMSMVIDKSQIQIYDSRKPVDVDEKGNISVSPLENVERANEALKKYNAKLFNSGLFWEQKKKNFLYDKTAYKTLIDGLKSVRDNNAINIDNDNIRDKILILSILIKYLEENGIDNNGKNLAATFFIENTGYGSFIEILRNNKIVDLLNALANKFNGGVFKLDEKEEKILKNIKLDDLSTFLEGRLDSNNQLLLWQQYSFKYIPIELISNIYEEFLPKNQSGKKEDKGAVYTPQHLVNFLVDECLPLSNNDKDKNWNIKLIDVSCGSGIFLATAFKRLVQRWRIKKSQNGKLGNIDIESIKKIQKNIYGVDINKTACDLTTFSINIALCSMLTPTQIWSKSELKFNDLSTNIINKDFFEYLVENAPNDFDLVIGNPPFNFSKSDKAKDVYKKYRDLLECHNKLFSCEIPDYNPALMFLDKSMDLLKNNGLLCLIMPSGPLLYNNTLDFRKCFFEKYNIPQIIDFTFSRNSLFNANVATVAIFAQNKKPNENNILHLTVKRTKTSKEKNYFEIDHYDFHYIEKEVAKESDYVWKASLTGGNRVYNLIEKIKFQAKNETFNNFIQSKNWICREGYKYGNRSKNDKEKIIIRQQAVETSFFTEDGIKKIVKIDKDTKFETIPVKDVFEPPHILIKESIGKKNIPIVYRNDYLTFRNEIIGIHAPRTEENELKEILNVFKKYNDIFRFYIVSTSSRFGVQRTPYTIEAKDIYNLPYFEKDIHLSEADKIIISDIDYIIDSFACGENAKINKEVQLQDIQDFSKVYCDVLNSIYKEGNKQYVLTKAIEGLASIACVFEFTEQEQQPEFITGEDDFSELLNNWKAQNVLIKRVLRIYDDNKKIILIKPKALRYWLRSIALRDVDETLADVVDNYLK